MLESLKKAREEDWQRVQREADEEGFAELERNGRLRALTPDRKPITQKEIKKAEKELDELEKNS